MYILTNTDLYNVLNNMINNCPNYIIDVQFIYELMRLTGCRCSEAIDRNRWELQGDGSYKLYTLKNNNPRYFDTVNLPIEFENYLAKVEPLDRTLTYRQVQFHAAKFLDKWQIKIENSNRLLHLFRHLYIRNLIDVGHSLSTIQEMLGHTHEANTERYANSIIYTNYATSPTDFI